MSPLVSRPSGGVGSPNGLLGRAYPHLLTHIHTNSHISVLDPLTGRSLPAVGTLKAVPHPTVSGACLVLQAARLGEVCIMEQVGTLEWGCGGRKENPSSVWNETRDGGGDLRLSHEDM